MYDIVIHHSFFVKELFIGSSLNIKTTCRPQGSRAQISLYTLVTLVRACFEQVVLEPTFLSRHSWQMIFKYLFTLTKNKNFLYPVVILDQLHLPFELFKLTS